MKVAYAEHGQDSRCFGYELDDDFEHYMINRVAPRYRDDEGDRLLSDMDSAGQAGFEPETLKSTAAYIPSRIAEVLAECFLMDHHNVSILYNRLRDSINPRASPTGPDIIGIADARFIFGETKSSSQQKHPPSPVYGKSGLIEQLNDIKKNGEKRRNMIKWLGHKIRLFELDRASWRQAKQRYCESGDRDFKICGVLVRDTKPNKRDTAMVYDEVSKDMRRPTLLDILALYIPVPISRLADMIRGGQG